MRNLSPELTYLAKYRHECKVFATVTPEVEDDDTPPYKVTPRQLFQLHCNVFKYHQLYGDVLPERFRHPRYVVYFRELEAMEPKSTLAIFDSEADPRDKPIFVRTLEWGKEYETRISMPDFIDWDCALFKRPKAFTRA